MRRLLHAIVVVFIASCFFLPAHANAQEVGGIFGGGRGGLGGGALGSADVRSDLRDIIQDETQLLQLLRNPQRNAAAISRILADLHSDFLDLQGDLGGVGSASL